MSDNVPVLAVKRQLSEISVISTVEEDVGLITKPTKADVQILKVRDLGKGGNASIIYKNDGSDGKNVYHKEQKNNPEDNHSIKA